MSAEILLVAVADIRVGTRHRKDLGDLAGLAASMAGPAGLLQPIGLDPSHALVFGERRLAAAKSLGWVTIPARVIAGLADAAAALAAERDENTCRKEMAPTELASLGRVIEENEAGEAKQRQAAAGPSAGRGAKKTGSGKLPEPVAGDTRDKVGKALGVSGKTYEKMKRVVEAAEAEPERFGDLPAKMDAKSVDAAHRELQARLRVRPGGGPTPPAVPPPPPARPPVATPAGPGPDAATPLTEDQRREIAVAIGDLNLARRNLARVRASVNDAIHGKAGRLAIEALNGAGPGAGWAEDDALPERTRKSTGAYLIYAERTYNSPAVAELLRQLSVAISQLSRLLPEKAAPARRGRRRTG